MPDRTLIIRFEQLTETPAWIWERSELEFLCLSDNRLTAIPGAIQSGKLAGAALDVLPQEPPPDDHPLLVAWRDPEHPAHDRVILNPHSAFYAEEGLLDMRVKGARASTM